MTEMTGKYKTKQKDFENSGEILKKNEEIRRMFEKTEIFLRE